MRVAFHSHLTISRGKREADQELPYLWHSANECEMPSSVNSLQFYALPWPFLCSSMGLVLWCHSASTSQIPSVGFPGVSQAFGNSEFPTANISCLVMIYVTFIFGEERGETLQWESKFSHAIVWESVPKVVHWLLTWEIQPWCFLEMPTGSSEE